MSCSDVSFDRLVTSIIDASRDDVVAVVSDHLRRNQPPDTVYSAVFHAAVRAEKRFGVSGYPHAMLTVRSARVLSRILPQETSLYPLFCTLDPLKNEQRFVTSRTALKSLDETRVPATADEAARQFQSAMTSWEPERADTAIVGMYRHGGMRAVREPLYRFATRKQLGIGHFPILVAQAMQSLSAFGWGCAEPVLRQMGQALALPPGPYDEQIFNSSRQLVSEHTLPAGPGMPDVGATRELLAMARDGSSTAITREVMRMLQAGISARSCWDAVVLCGAEIILRDVAGDAHGMARLTPSAIGVHLVDTANALRFVFDQTNDTETRTLCLLQAAAWMPSFVRTARFAKSGPGIAIDQLEPSSATPQTLDDIFVATGTDHLEAGRRALAWIHSNRSMEELQSRSVELAIRKFSDPHQFKYPVALLEEAARTSPRWRPVMVATLAMYGKLDADADWDMLEQTRDAIASLPS